VFRTVGLVITASFLCGCFTTTKLQNTWSMVMAVQPQATDPFSPPVVESLQPVLVWIPSRQKDVLYDLVIHECSLRRGRVEVGEQIYYREGLSATEHKVETSLEPNRTYSWSVRLRHADNASEWSRYDYDRVIVTPSAALHEWCNGTPFTLRTPTRPVN
jgi:hypothetical protein